MTTYAHACSFDIVSAFLAGDRFARSMFIYPASRRLTGRSTRMLNAILFLSVIRTEIGKEVSMLGRPAN